MIDYQTYCQLRHLFTQKGLGLRQIARQLKLGLNTVRKWAGRQSYQRAPIPKRASKLDPYKAEVECLMRRWETRGGPSTTINSPRTAVWCIGWSKRQSARRRSRSVQVPHGPITGT